MVAVVAAAIKMVHHRVVAGRRGLAPQDLVRGVAFSVPCFIGVRSWCYGWGYSPLASSSGLPQTCQTPKLCGRKLTVPRSPILIFAVMSWIGVVRPIHLPSISRACHPMYPKRYWRLKTGNSIATGALISKAWPALFTSMHALAVWCRVVRP